MGHHSILGNHIEPHTSPVLRLIRKPTYDVILCFVWYWYWITSVVVELICRGNVFRACQTGKLVAIYGCCSIFFFVRRKPQRELRQPWLGEDLARLWRSPKRWLPVSVTSASCQNITAMEYSKRGESLLRDCFVFHVLPSVASMLLIAKNIIRRMIE